MSESIIYAYCEEMGIYTNSHNHLWSCRTPSIGVLEYVWFGNCGCSSVHISPSQTQAIRQLNKCRWVVWSLAVSLAFVQRFVRHEHVKLYGHWGREYESLSVTLFLTGRIDLPWPPIINGYFVHISHSSLQLCKAKSLGFCTLTRQVGMMQARVLLQHLKSKMT